MPLTILLDDTIPTDLARISGLLDHVEQAIEARGGDRDGAFKVKLAFEEALTNAMRHGNKMDVRRSVRVVVSAGEGRVCVDVRDEGDGFDPAAVPDPTAGAHAGRPNGRGVFLMRALMDEVSYYDGGRGVTMKKQIAGIR